jgi:hypothetical protein
MGQKIDIATNDALRRYANESAATAGDDYAAAVQRMDDDPDKVAAVLGCSAATVKLFADLVLGRTP